MSDRTGNIRFERLSNERTFASPELQARADSNPLTDGRMQFRVWMGDREAAYLSFDIFWPDQLNLYEIFIVREFRSQRLVGPACVGFGVELARELHKPRLTVLPTPLSEQTTEELVGWYKRRGFTPTDDPRGLLEIVLT